MHLTPRSYRQMPWANGRGATTQLYRADDADGKLLWRISMAMVVEDGAFSVFAGMDRSLTLISGPEFDLVGPGIALHLAPLAPVAFPGDAEIRATGVLGPSSDFNVISNRLRIDQRVWVSDPGVLDLAGEIGALFMLEPGSLAVGDALVQAGRHDLLITDQPVRVTTRAALIAVELRFR